MSKELKRLGQLNILISAKQGNLKYYWVNEKSPIFPELKGLVIKSIGLVETLQNEFDGIKRKIKVAFIFGSFAKEKESLQSDIDLMVVGKVSFGEVVEILEKVEKKLNREINPVVMDEEEMKERLKKKDHFLIRVLEEPKIWIFGDEREIKRMAKKRLVSRA